MPLPKPKPPTPTTIGVIRIELVDIPANDTRLPSASPEARQEIRYNIEVFDANHALIAFPDASGDLETHLTKPQVNALKNVLTNLRVRAEAEILG